VSFSQKLINVSLDLASGEFQGGGNSAMLSGLRVTCHISVTGGPTQSEAEVAIYGLPLSMMNQLSNVGAQYNKSLPNGITIYAGDAEMGMNLVFAGQIFTAFVDARGMPEVAFRVLAKPGYYDKIKPADPISIQGAADVSGLMSQIAGKMGLGFEDAGVKVKLANPYFPGTLMMQAAQIAEHAGIEWIVDKGTLAIMPAGKPRAGGAVLISPQTGMVGYPLFNENEVIVQSLYNPAVQYGGLIEIKSDLTAANGTWIVRSLDYYLDSLVPRGKWFMVVGAYIAGQTTP
jgi:hypothetical protein